MVRFAALCLASSVLLCAGWREDAQSRIEKARKAELTVQVADSSGRPVANAEVRVRMKRHAFAWGSAVAAQSLLGDTPDSDKYRAAVLELFNAVVFENDLKWPQWEQDRQRAMAGLKWMREHGITRVRGHNLVWPGWRWLPRDLKALDGDAEKMRKRVLDHVREEAETTAGWVSEWDVINEPYSNKDLQRILGDEAMIEWFKAAKFADPKAVLYLNDYDIFENGATKTEHRDHFDRTIEWLLKNGAPLEGIGIQGHFKTPTKPEILLEILDRFARHGKPITITEFDYNIEDEAAQAEFTRDFLTVCFSHPSVDGFLMWGFWEGRHWLPKSAMLRRDWSEKPNYAVYKDLVFREWWTDTTARTGQGGKVAVRGFHGDYDVEVTRNGKRAISPAQLRSGGASIRVVFDSAGLR